MRARPPRGRLRRGALARRRARRPGRHRQIPPAPRAPRAPPRGRTLERSSRSGAAIRSARLGVLARRLRAALGRGDRARREAASASPRSSRKYLSGEDAARVSRSPARCSAGPGTTRSAAPRGAARSVTHGRSDPRGLRRSSVGDGAAAPGRPRARGPAVGRRARRCELVDVALRELSARPLRRPRARAPGGARALPAALGRARRRRSASASFRARRASTSCATRSARSRPRSS